MSEKVRGTIIIMAFFRIILEVFRNILSTLNKKCEDKHNISFALS
jgi:hypothetical protein